MGLKKKLTKIYRKFLFEQLLRRVRARQLRPFQVDEDGVWFVTQHGFAIRCNFEDRILELDVNPVWEPMETAFVLNNIHPGDVVVDVGANIGYFSLVAAQRQPARVLAIEPVPRTFDLLTGNVRHNKVEDIVQPVNIALGSHDHTVRFVDTLGPKNHVEYAVDNEHRQLSTVETRVTTLDAFLKGPVSVDKVDFIKVDIEGYEHQFLQGARETIATFRPLMLMEVEQHRLIKFGVQAKDVFDFMAEVGYQYLCVREHEITPAASFEDDLAAGRDFVFYTSDHRPVY